MTVVVVDICRTYRVCDSVTGCDSMVKTVSQSDMSLSAHYYGSHTAQDVHNWVEVSFVYLDP